MVLTRVTNSHVILTPTINELTWNNTTRIAGDEAVARIREPRAADGGDLVVMGSPTLVRTLLGEGLVDELQLVIMPVLLGGGKSIFPADGGLRTLELASTTISPAGVHVCTYRPVTRG
ncbi:dihydrofolate reductase family protein [Streptomyces sp. NBC_00853]|uniref:dihydrofolate reductase family protein n=1 Tax=Streptomyces sp. NBC_00853 TaxID=2903681 RepID=UPI0038736871|nr:dihydrofolate reductase family protein [Streptomyces sp. NBC_00853]